MTETLGSLYCQALLILTKSSKSKNQAAPQQKFKELLRSTCQNSSERIVLDLELELRRFHLHLGTYLLVLDITETASTYLFAQASLSTKNGSEIATFCLLRTKPLLRSLLIMPTIINLSVGQITIANVLVNDPCKTPYDLSIDSGRCEQI